MSDAAADKLYALFVSRGEDEWALGISHEHLALVHGLGELVGREEQV